jgi:hypothetical protein
VTVGSHPVLSAILLVAALTAASATGQEAVPPDGATSHVSPAAPFRRLRIADAGTSLVAMPPESPRELSGLSWAGGDLFYAVSDSDRAVHPFAIDVGSADGRVRSVTRREPIALFDDDGRPSGGTDLEGVAFDSAGPTITVVNESGYGQPGRSMLIYRAADGRQIGAIDLAGTHFDSERIRGGLGLESLARLGETVWTANEEALNGDGPRSNGQRGTLVRLTRFDKGQLTGQWVYPTERTGGALPYFNTNMGGVVDLVALADGRLLVLERATAGSQGPGDFGGFINRIYLVEVSTGTNVLGQSALEPLEAGRDYRPVEKQLLWSKLFSLLNGPTNFEGMALGPALADGSRSLILVSDNDVLPSTLWALRLSEAPAGPRTVRPPIPALTPQSPPAPLN